MLLTTRLLTQDHLDDGFSILSGDEYSIVRTQVLLDDAQTRLEPLATRKEIVQARPIFSSRLQSDSELMSSCSRPWGYISSPGLILRR